MSVLVAIALLYFLDIVSPLPLQQTQSGPEYTGWEPQPRGRGSFGLIVNCLITLSLCVWTAVHLNVPARRLPKKTSRFARCRSSYAYTRLRWMFLGLLAPELAVYAAWRQWTSARILCKKMNEILLKQKYQGPNQKDDNTLKNHSWTLVHGFYATMGGFVIDTYSSKDGEYIPDSPRVTLTAKGVLFLAQRGYNLPSMTKESILDRSKADGLAKGLVCLQAGYMIVQCAGRQAAGLPISLLEINTLGHVICALIMYLFWLQKPQDIHEPTLVDFEGIEAASAYMWMCSNMSETVVGEPREMSQLCYYPTITATDSVSLDSITLAEEHIINPSETTENLEAETFLPSVLEDKADPVPFLQRSNKPRAERGKPLPFYEPPANSTVISENEYLRGSQLGPANAKEVLFTRKLVRAGAVDRATSSNQQWQPTRIGLDNTGIRRWRLASSFISKHWSSLYLENPQDPKDEINSPQADVYRPVPPSLPLLPPNPPITQTEVSKTKRPPVVFGEIVYKTTGYHPFLVIKEVPNWPTSAGLLSGFQELPWIVISITTGLYGGLHATAWYDHFPSKAEQILWCTSCVIIAASGILTGIAISMDRLPKKLGWWKPSNNKEYQESAMLYYFWEHDLSFWGIPFWVVVLFTFLIVVVPAFLAVVLYIPARVFLVVEAFISLRNAPAGTYLTPDWTQWIPHL